MIDHIRRLELIGHATWPSLEDEWLNGWLLRAGGGVTRRANSANPVYDLAADVDLDQQVARCERWFEQRGLRPKFRLSPIVDSTIDARLEARGYEKDLGAVIMTRPIDEHLAADPGRAIVTAAPTGPWLDLMAEEPGRGGPKRDVLRSMLGGVVAPAGFAGIEENGLMQAIGLGVVAEDHVAIFMMRTADDHRRRGLARAIAAALIQWGVRQGTTDAFLQVHPSNAAAIALYRSLGFEKQYEYWYRQ